MARTSTPENPAAAAQRASVGARRTVPLASTWASARVAGRQCRMLQPYISRTVASPGAVKVSATRSSATRTLPPSASSSRAARRAPRVAHVRVGVAYAAAATAAWAEGRLDQAGELARRGVEAAGGPTAPTAAAPLEALGDVAMLRGDLAAALEAYRGVAAATGPGDPAGLAVRDRQPGAHPGLCGRRRGGAGGRRGRGGDGGRLGQPHRHGHGAVRRGGGVRRR